jgi:hypothetical protein
VAADGLRQSMIDTTSKEAILRLAKAISDDLYVAIANYEVFVPSGRDSALIERVNDQQVHAGFKVISEALQSIVISREQSGRESLTTGGPRRLAEEELPLADVTRKRGVGGMPGLLVDLERRDARPSRAGGKAGAQGYGPNIRQGRSLQQRRARTTRHTTSTDKSSRRCAHGDRHDEMPGHLRSGEAD